MKRRPGRGISLRIADRPRPGRGASPRRWRAVVQTLLVIASLLAVFLPLHECTTAARRRAPARLVRGPYLQLGTARSVTVVWETTAPAVCSLELQAPDGPSRRIPGATSGRCAIAVDGLSPGTRYRYVPWADEAPIDTESDFRTDAPGEPFSFLVLGDSGSGSPDQLAVADRMRDAGADFVLHTGDVIYPRGGAEDYDARYFRPYRDLIRRVVLWPCIGNHDLRTGGGAPWRAVFETPANNGSHAPTYYSFDFGNAHVTVLDSNASTRPGSPQHVFLDRDLGKSPATWKVVAFHHPIFSSGKHGGSRQIRDDVLPLLERHGVDLVFAGHDHDYERTKPLRWGEVVAPGAGTVYVTTGGGGAPLYGVGWSEFTAHAESSFHFVRVHVEGERLRLEMIRQDGSVGDAADVVPRPPGPSRSA